jgi:hypothetical protein
MPGEYTIGISAFKRALSEVIASVGPPSGDPTWLKSAQSAAQSLHGNRAFDPDLAFDLQLMEEQLAKIHRRAAKEHVEATARLRRFEEAGANFEKNVDAITVQSELHSLGQDALHPDPVTQEEIEEAIEESAPTALLPTIPERFVRPGGGQPTSCVRMPVRFAGVGDLPATRQTIWKTLKVVGLSFLAGFIAGMLSRKIF